MTAVVPRLPRVGFLISARILNNFCGSITGSYSRIFDLYFSGYFPCLPLNGGASEGKCDLRHFSGCVGR